MEPNLENTVNFLHEHCKAKGIDFMCYVGSATEKDKGLLVVTTTNADSMLDAIAVNAKKSNNKGVLRFFIELSIKLKRKYIRI